MAISRLFCSSDLQAGSKVDLDKTASHHLTTVLRAREGEAVCLFNGDGYDYFGVIESVTKNKSTCVSVTEATPNLSESPIHTCLIQGISRNDRMDFTLQKATELGVNRIIAFRTDLVNQRIPFERLQKKTGHWDAVIQSAAGQSGRARLPDFQLADKLASAIAAAHNEAASAAADSIGKWILVPEGACSLAASITTKSTTKSATKPATKPATEPCISSAQLIVGPERGLSEAEQELAQASGFEAVSLGPRILRTETAPLVVLSIIQTLLGDMG